MQVGIIGLGLMGGSLGLALKKSRFFKRILGYDNNPMHLQQALSLGLIDEGAELKEIKECDVIFLATPVQSIIDMISHLEDVPPNCCIIDLGSVKEKILKNIPQALRKNFVGAHPMCGTELNGPRAAVENLYENKIVILTDLEESGEFQTAIAKEVFISIGMQIIKLDSRSHDCHIALISHLPHIISFALANTVLTEEKKEMILALVGGGFRDMSRISKSSPLLWRDIFKQNKDNLLDALKKFNAELEYAQNLIMSEKWQELEEWLRKANILQSFLS